MIELYVFMALNMWSRVVTIATLPVMTTTPRIAAAAAATAYLRTAIRAYGCRATLYLE